MGEVWQARDTALDREAAIKTLPGALAQDTERLARFEREAKLLASLNHPKITSVYGLHEAGGERFIGMEFVGGEDLAERLARGAVPVDDAIEIGLGIARALESGRRIPPVSTAGRWQRRRLPAADRGAGSADGDGPALARFGHTRRAVPDGHDLGASGPWRGHLEGATRWGRSRAGPGAGRILGVDETPITLVTGWAGEVARLVGSS